MASSLSYEDPSVCTLIAFHKIHPQFPLIVAANRDEYYARRTSGPEVLATSPRTVGGRDLEKGGTWLAAAEGGLFAAITNQRAHHRAPTPPSSRGHVVTNVIASGSVDLAIAYVERLDARAYAPFNLLFGDARALHLAYARPGWPKIHVEPAPRGLFVLANDRLGSAEFPKTRRAEELARPLIEKPWHALVQELPRVLADHERAPLESIAEPPPGSWLTRELDHQLQSTCVHTPHYGTRSSTILAVGANGVVHYLFANGPPCVTRFADVTNLLARS